MLLVVVVLDTISHSAKTHSAASTAENDTGPSHSNQVFIKFTCLAENREVKKKLS